MAEYRLKSKKKPSGGTRHSRKRCDKKLAWKGNPPASSKIDEKEVREKHRSRSGKEKVKLKKAFFAMVSEKGKSRKAKIKQVIENNANRHYARQNIITKGAVIEIESGNKTAKAIVTARPGQKGTVQAKVLE